MQPIAMRLKENLEVERYLFPNSASDPREDSYPSFPFKYYTLDFHYYFEDNMPWHWHYDNEIIEVISGCITIKSSQSIYQVHSGELCYINPKTLHTVLPGLKGSDPVLYLHLFSPELVHGGWGNAFDSRYVSPILDCRGMDLFYFSVQNTQTADLKERLREARKAYDDQTFGYEFDVRKAISEGWKNFFLAALPRLQQRRSLSDRSEERMQKMLAFIQLNYPQNLTTKDIADSAMISERECFRCFQNILGITPTLYLRNYRIRMAARQLLETDLPVQTICDTVGFHDLSYFGRAFRKIMHSTPTAFRKTGLQPKRKEERVEGKTESMRNEIVEEKPDK